MNYRHAFHAGNFADVLKHIVLARILAYLTRKETPLRVIDTHAGIGLYDLSSDEAIRTNEARDGVEKVFSADIPPDIAALLAPWQAAIAAENPGGGLLVYPGSPAIARRLTRRQDRLTLVELHPQDARVLALQFAADRRAKVVELDGWLALNSFVPPKETRGLVLVDPAFEETGELERLTAGLAKAWRKWSTGVYLGWFPIKTGGEAEFVRDGLAEAGISRGYVIDFRVRAVSPGPLPGCGLAVINPPFTLAEELKTLLPWLVKTIGHGGPGAAAKVLTLPDAAPE